MICPFRKCTQYTYSTNHHNVLQLIEHYADCYEEDCPYYFDGNCEQIHFTKKEGEK